MSRQPPTRCSVCDSQEILTVLLSPHGDPISFTICNACGWKQWGRGEESVRLSVVRPLLGKRRPDPVELDQRDRRTSERSPGGRGAGRRTRSGVARRGQYSGPGDAA
jgi:hypothetical protein